MPWVRIAKTSAILRAKQGSYVLDVEFHAILTPYRGLFSLRTIDDQPDAAQKAKISADMLIVRKTGERAAYGLDDSEAARKTVEREMSVLEVAHRLA